MAVMIGQQPDSGFDQPLALLRDCHRRIEKFLDVLIRVVDERRGGELGDEYRKALESALRYFKNAAPWHTRDEEDSLFPRMRGLSDARVAAAMTRIDALESDHRVADEKHAAVDAIGRRWLDAGTITADEADRLRVLLVELRTSYRRHITEEDDVIFPLAADVLTPEQIEAIGREMAARRGLDTHHSGPRCRHAKANRS